MEYEEHEKRAWSVDFCRTEPSMLVSGSDDCKVKRNSEHVFSQVYVLPNLVFGKKIIVFLNVKKI